MTPTIIPYSQFLSKPWQCMALHALPAACMSLLSHPQRRCRQWTAQCQHDSNVRLDGNVTAMEQHDGDGRLFGDVTAMDGMMAIQLRWSSRWGCDGDDRTMATAMNAQRRRPWMAWLGDGWLGDGRREDSAMDGLTAMQHQ
jgi:hypothetical protein